MPHERDSTEQWRDLAVTAPWAEWLRTIKWDFWCTGTFAGAGPSEGSVRGRVEQWLQSLTDERRLLYGTGGQKVYAALAIEQGAVFYRWHAHMLVGGVGAHPDMRAALIKKWRWGNILVDPYDPKRDPRGEPMTGACAYLSKHPDCIQLVGRLRKWRPR